MRLIELALLLAGPLALESPAHSPGAPSSTVRVFAVIGAGYTALLIVVLVFFVLSQVADSWRSWRGKRRDAELVSGSRIVSNPPSVSTEPDPIESYLEGKIGGVCSPVEKAFTDDANEIGRGEQNRPEIPAVRVWVHRENQMPLPFNPVGRSDATMRIRE